jgi:hypothetical protein
MKLFLIPLLSFLCLLTLTVPQAAQSAPPGVPDDSFWSDSSGTLLHVDVTENPNAQPGNCWIQATDADGFTTLANGVMDANGCQKSGEFTNGVDTFKVAGGKLYKKGKRGKWILMKKVKVPRKKGYGPPGRGRVYIPWGGEEVASLPQ